MSAVFAELRARLRPNVASNAGFSLYWLGWCFAFPTWVLGEQQGTMSFGAAAAQPSARRRSSRSRLAGDDDPSPHAAAIAGEIYGGSTRAGASRISELSGPDADTGFPPEP